MHISAHAPLYPILQGPIWELPALHQMLAALDECHIARQQGLMLAGEAQERALLQLQDAEYKLSEAKTTLRTALDELPVDKDRCTVGTLLDLEAAWESNLILPTLPPTPPGRYPL